MRPFVGVTVMVLLPRSGGYRRLWHRYHHPARRLCAGRPGSSRSRTWRRLSTLPRPLCSIEGKVPGRHGWWTTGAALDTGAAGWASSAQWDIAAAALRRLSLRCRDTKQRPPSPSWPGAERRMVRRHAARARPKGVSGGFMVVHTWPPPEIILGIIRAGEVVRLFADRRPSEPRRANDNAQRVRRRFATANLLNAADPGQRGTPFARAGLPPRRVAPLSRGGNRPPVCCCGL